MGKTFAVVGLLSALVFALTAEAATVKIGSVTWRYNKTSTYDDEIGDYIDAVTVNGASNFGNTLTIPVKINGLPVVGIGNWSFDENKAIAKLVVPKGVKWVGEGAFEGCPNLVEVILPEGLTWLGLDAFCDCPKLTKINIPSTLREEISFPFCYKLKTVAISEEHPDFTLRDGVLYSKDLSRIVCCLPGRTGGFAVPESVVEIADEAFAGSSVTNVCIGSHVELIGKGAFLECHKLKGISVDIDNPNYMSEGGALYSKDGSHLVNYPAGKSTAKVYTVPSHVTSIGDDAYAGCKWTGVVLPSTITSLGYETFEGCENLTSVIVGRGVVTIGEAFYYTPKLKEIMLPDTLETIDYGAFEEAETLKSVYLPRAAVIWDEDDGRPASRFDETPAKVVRYTTARIVRFERGDGEECPYDRNVVSGRPVGILPTPSRKGYAFAGWYTSANGGIKVTAATTVTKDATYHARWQAKVTATVEGSGKVSGSGSYAVGKRANLVATANVGNEFVGWYDEEGEFVSASASYSPVVEGPLILKAVFRRMECTYRFNSNGGTLEGESTGSVLYGDALSVAIDALPVPERIGYDFKGWYTAKAKGAKVSLSTRVVAKSVTYYAIWTARKYKIAFDGAGGCKSPTVSGFGTYATGADVTIKAISPKGYAFLYWDYVLCDAGGDYDIPPSRKQANSFKMPPGNCLVQAAFTKISEDTAPVITFSEKVWYVEDMNEVEVSVESQSYPSLKKTLPSGISLVSKDNGWGSSYVLRVSSRAKLAAGVQTVTIEATNRSGKKSSKSLRVVTFNKTQAVDKGVLKMRTSTGSPYRMTVGVKQAWSALGISAASGWTISSVTGIPGLTWDAKKKTMTGYPTKSGVYAAVVTVTKGKTKYVATATFEISALPKSVARTFKGWTIYPQWLYDDETGESTMVEEISPYSERFTISITSAGKVSAKIGSDSLDVTGLKYESGLYKATITKYWLSKDKKSWFRDELRLAVDPSANDALAETTFIKSGGTTAKDMVGMWLMEYELRTEDPPIYVDEDSQELALLAASGGQGLAASRDKDDASPYTCWDLTCLNCTFPPTKALAVVVKEYGTASVSGSLGGKKISATSKVYFEDAPLYDGGEVARRPVVRFVSGTFFLQIVFDTGRDEFGALPDSIPANGAAFGKAWKR